MKPARVLALDLGTSTGWCAGTAGKPTTDSVVLFKAGYDNGAIAASLCDWLADMITMHDPTVIYFESPLNRGDHSGVQAGRILLGLSMVVELVAWRREVPCREANVSTVRKAVVGRGNARKPDVMTWCLANGMTPPNFDASDACVLWEYGHQMQAARRIAA